MSAVHTSYVTLAQSGIPTDALANDFVSADQALIERGAEAILLGGTDLNAILTEEVRPFPIVDCASIHFEDIVKRI